MQPWRFFVSSLSSALSSMLAASAALRGGFCFGFGSSRSFRNAQRMAHSGQAFPSSAAGVFPKPFARRKEPSLPVDPSWGLSKHSFEAVHLGEWRGRILHRAEGRRPCGHSGFLSGRASSLGDDCRIKQFVHAGSRFGGLQDISGQVCAYWYPFRSHERTLSWCTARSSEVPRLSATSRKTSPSSWRTLKFESHLPLQRCNG